MAYVPRRAVGVTIGSFLLRFVFIVVLGATLLYLLNRKTANTYFAQFGSQTGDNVNGVWIGVLDSYNDPLSADQLALNPDLVKRKPVTLRAAILINMHVTDAFLKGYQGDGLFYTQNNPGLRTLDSVEFDIPNGVLQSGQMFTFSDPRGLNIYKGSQNLSGSLHDGALDLSVDFGKYGFRGQLHHGTKAEYLQLCRSLGLSDWVGKE